MLLVGVAILLHTAGQLDSFRAVEQTFALQVVCVPLLLSTAGTMEAARAQGLALLIFGIALLLYTAGALDSFLAPPTPPVQKRLFGIF